MYVYECIYCMYLHMCTIDKYVCILHAIFYWNSPSSLVYMFIQPTLTTRVWKTCVETGLVKCQLLGPFDETCFILMTPSLIFSLINCQSIWICLNLSCWTGFHVILIVEQLSHNILIGRVFVCPSSFKALFSHNPLHNPRVNAVSSVFALLLATNGCFFTPLSDQIAPQTSPISSSYLISVFDPTQFAYVNAWISLSSCFLK